MNKQNNKKQLDELISHAVGRENLKFDFGKWKEQNQKEIQDFQVEIKQPDINNPVLTNIWRTIMNNRITKFAAAAVIIIAVMLGINYIGGSPDGVSVALGEVLEKMEKINSYTCEMTSWQVPVQSSSGTESAEKKAVTMQFRYSDEYGFKMEQYTDGQPSLIVCMLRKSNEGIRIWPKEKKYIRVQLTDEERAIMKPQEMDPREWVRLFLAADYKTLGQKVIDGATAEGVEINELGVIRKSSGQSPIKNYAARLWIDINSQLPVQLEEEYTLGSVHTGGSGKHFQWNVVLTPSDLEPDIPEDYTHK
ncbi:MAG: hypothetical protein JW837_09900 [Sedimentisphaerales bacterium]|nr:hypothetical protein [Sedimentisphaerales bacterium]